MAKAHAMSLRGFKQNLIGRKTITKIMTSIIMPILTYGLESFPMSEENYLHIDTFVSKALNQTLTTSDNESETQGIQDNSYWIMFENDLTPPLALDQKKQSIDLRKIHQKRSRSKLFITKFLQNKFPAQRNQTDRTRMVIHN
jgi:hypothetical protein